MFWVVLASKVDGCFTNQINGMVCHTQSECMGQYRILKGRKQWGKGNCSTDRNYRSLYPRLVVLPEAYAFGLSGRINFTTLYITVF